MPRFPQSRRLHWVLSALAVASVVIALGSIVGTMPLKRNSPALAPLTPSELDSRARIRTHIHTLAGTIGGRDALRYKELHQAITYIERELRSYGYSPQKQSFSVDGKEFENIEVEQVGSEDPKSIVVVGAHYDTAGGLPGANDNGSGVAATLELACGFAKRSHKRSVRWVFFANEEPPYFQTPGMGSYVYAKRCHEREEKVIAMLSLETIGYYADEPGSQVYPIGFHPGYPDRGNFLGFVANFGSVGLLRSALKSFRDATTLPATGAAAPASIPGVGWSDHWSFWQFGYKAIMLTDTAPYRYPYYHAAQDTPDKIDYDRLTRAFTGIAAIVDDLGK
jgi:Zn-dependent M28 family amino/carboxypeptidase